MKLYDVTCPKCGKENKNLYLEETNGVMECEACGTIVQALEFKRFYMLPCFSMNENGRLSAESMKMIGRIGA